MSSDIEMLDDDVSSFLGYVSYEPITSWENNHPLMFYAYACAKKYVPQGKSFEEWSQEATVESYYEQVYAMKSLPEELNVPGLDARSREQLWNDSVRKSFERRCEEEILPLVCDAVEEDARKWKIQIPPTRGSKDYEQFMIELAKRKAYELFGYFSEVEGSDFKFKSKDISERVEELQSEVERIIEAEADYDIAWFERPLRMNDEQWTAEKKRMIERRKEETEQEEDITDEQKEKDRLEKEENDRDTARAHAIKSTSNEVVQPRVEIDPNARRLFFGALSILNYWWDHGVQKNDREKLAAINKSVDIALRPRQGASSNKWGVDYGLAPSELEFWIEKIRANIESVERASSTESEKSILELAQNVISFSNIARKHGLDWKCIANRGIQHRVLTYLYQSSSDEVRKRRESLIESMLEIYPEQKQFLERFGAILMVAKSAMESKNCDTLRIVIDNINEINNEEAQKINTDLGLKRDDHSFPVHHLRSIADHNCDQGVMINQLEQLRVKLRLLSIPDTAFDSLLPPYEVTQHEVNRHARELLGLESKQNESPEVQASYPRLTSSITGLPFAWCPDKKTVAWGRHNGLFFINQYGSNENPIWRKEPQPLPGFRDKQYENGLPPHKNVSDAKNRIGSTLIPGSSTKRKYATEEYIKDILGVAFEQTSGPDDILDFDKQYNRAIYVLIDWNIHLNDVDTNLRWEPATEYRLRMGNARGNELIQTQAMENQARFDNFYKDICPISPCPSPQLPPEQSLEEPSSTSIPVRNRGDKVIKKKLDGRKRMGRQRAE